MPESKCGRPEYLYKYRPLRSAIDLIRLLETLETGTLYAALLGELNDPMEGRGVSIGCGYAGVSIVMRAGKTPGRFLRDVMRHRVLCLAEHPTSPQMWAHYGDGYTGVCLQFRTSEMNFDTHAINYVEKPERVFCPEYQTEGSIDIARKALLTKHADWSYECEHRAVFYMGLGDEELNKKVKVGRPSALIIGEECDDTIMRLLKSTADVMGIPVYQTYIADLRYEVKVIPLGGMRGRFGEDLEDQIRRECDEAGIPRSDCW